MPDLPWWLSQLLLPMAVALVSGIGGSILWEGVLRARRDRLALVAALRAEIQNNVHHAQYYASKRKSRESIPPTFRLQDVVFRAVANRLGDLDPEEIGRVAGCYRLFDELNRHVERYRELQHFRATADSGDGGLILRDMLEECAQFYAALDTLLFQMADFRIGAGNEKFNPMLVLPAMPTIPAEDLDP